jgi:hypothetical protein
MEEVLSRLPVWLTGLMVGATVVRLATAIIGVVFYGRRAPIRREAERTVAIWVMSALLTVWVVVVLVLGRNAYFRVDESTLPPPPIAVAAVLSLLVGYGLFLLWAPFRRIVLSIPLHWMIGMQFLRVTGGAFLVLYWQGLLPGVFGIPAGVGDLVTGMLALPVAYFYYKRAPWAHKAALIWCYVGIAELLMLLPLGLLTSPSPIQQLAFDAPNYVTTNWPMVLAPTFHVPIGILIHLFTFAMLQRERQSLASPAYQGMSTSPAR